MNDLAKISAIVTTLMLPVGCVSTSTNMTRDDTTSPYSIGYYVTRTELCEKFDGIAFDRSKVAAIQHAYKYNTNYQLGYEKDRYLFDAKRLSGPVRGCDKSKNVINIVYNGLKKS